MSSTVTRWGPVILLLAALWLPRGLALDRFVTADEHAWLARSGNFFWALAHGEWAATFQRHHPGVTVTWAGLFGYLFTDPGYAAAAPGPFGWLTEEIEPFLRSRGHDPVTVLAAGRAAVVLLITLTLAASAWFWARLVDRRAAWVGMLLVAFAPFHIAHARLLHLDGLVSSFMLLAVLAWLDALRSRSPWSLATAAVAAGLAWLTRSPALYLAPFLALSGLAYAALTPDRPWPRVIRSGMLVGAGAAALFVLLWPAMWVDPLGSLRQVLDAAGEYAAEGHLKPTFFAGEIHAGDPGALFYPITYLWRTTPVTLAGLLLAATALLLRVAPLHDRRTRGVLAALLVYGLGFMLFMNLGAKKFDRYALPTYLPLELIAGAGWATLAIQSGRLVQRRWQPLLLLLVPVVVQAAFALPAFPYYLSYYNPLLGGSAAAPSVMMIGWGEGADQAGRTLDALPDAAQLTVASGYTNGPLSYFFRGRTWPLTYSYAADYAAVFIQDRQRLLPARRVAAYFDSLPTAQAVTVGGIDYAHLIDLRAAPVPEYTTDWLWTDPTSGQSTPVIRLVSFQAPSAPIQPGETVRTVFYLLNLAPIPTNLNVVARVVGRDGQEIARSEGWPWGAATSAWQSGVVWPDGHDLTIPAHVAPDYYSIELGFYDPATQRLLAPQQTASAAALPDLVPVEVIRVGRLPARPPLRFAPPVALGDVHLDGAAWTQDGRSLQPGGVLQPGATVTVALTWQTTARLSTDYTAFVHLVGPDGALVTQHDKPPVDGWLPMREWMPGHPVRDEFTLTVPADAPPGDYTLYTGFYDPVHNARQPVYVGTQPAGDAFRLGTLRVP